MATPRIWQVERWLGSQPQPLPHRFLRYGKRKIISWPTVYGWVMLLVLLIAGMTALNYNNGPAIAMALFMVMMYLCGIIFSQNPILALDLLSLVVPDSVAKQPGALLLTVRNRTRQESLFQIRAQGPLASCMVAGGESARLRVPLGELTRGRHKVPRLQLISYWPFGFCRSTGHFLPEGEMWVTPAILEDGLPIPGGHAPQQAAGVAQHGEHVHHLRPYQRGDAMRDVAWKASARTDTLLSRVYEQPKRGHCLVEWAAWDHLPLEQRLSQFATWLTQAEHLGWSSVLDTPRGRVGPGFGEAHLQQALRLLASWPTEDAV